MNLVKGALVYERWEVTLNGNPPFPPLDLPNVNRAAQESLYCFLIQLPPAP
ncbi:MAG TPA: hypothetical protein VK638_36415 [Edaphobacter sp.]|nr:hypothetical protein [Edaphobacter sp.]